MTERSSEENARWSSVVATEMTAITGPSLISGTNAALFAPVSAASRELHPGRAADVVDGEARRLVHGACDPRRLARQVEADVTPPVDVLSPRARQESGRLARVVGHERERDEADAKERRDLVEQRPRHPSTSEVRDSSAAIRRRLSSSRSRSGRSAADGPRGRPEPERDTPADEAEPERAKEGRSALQREREAIDADGKRLDRGHTGRADDTERQGLGARLFPADERRSLPRSKDGPSGPLSAFWSGV